MVLYRTLDELAARLGVERSHARKIAKDAGFSGVKLRIPELSHRQKVLVWTDDEVGSIVAERVAGGFKVPGHRWP